VPIESEWRLYFFVLTRFLDASASPDHVRGRLSLKNAPINPTAADEIFLTASRRAVFPRVNVNAAISLLHLKKLLILSLRAVVAQP
jgi:hypothetical protein